MIMIFPIILFIAILAHEFVYRNNIGSDNQPYIPEKPINEVARKIRGHIISCTRPRHLVVANREINLFRKQYCNHPNKDTYIKLLCSEAQLKRVQIKFQNKKSTSNNNQKPI